MIEIPDTLRAVFSATVREDAGTYTFEVPVRDVDNGTVQPGETYRVAVFGRTEESHRTAQQSPNPSTARANEPRNRSDPPVEEGEVREVTIESVGDQGDGIAKVERGFVVIVPGALPGDRPTVEIEDVRANVAFARVVETDSPPR